MKKRSAVLLAAILCVCLGGCAQAFPQKAADGQIWSEDWVTVGNIIGVDTPGGMDPRENIDALASNGMYYATWSIGEGEPYVNTDGEDAMLYEGQVYLLLAGYDAAEKAVDAAAEWLALANERYEVENTITDESCNGQTYEIVTYACDTDTNPYAWGTSAFGVYRNYAISVEIQCQDASALDPNAIMASFLANCHYAV